MEVGRVEVECMALHGSVCKANFMILDVGEE